MFCSALFAVRAVLQAPLGTLVSYVWLRQACLGRRQRHQVVGIRSQPGFRKQRIAACAAQNKVEMLFQCNTFKC